MEAGKRDDEEVRLAALFAGAHRFHQDPPSPSRHDPYTVNHHRHYHDGDYEHVDIVAAGEDPDSDHHDGADALRSALASYAANNHHAALDNAHVAFSEPAVADGALEPDDFYRNFGAAHGEHMASTALPAQRHPQPGTTPSSPLRGNSQNGSTSAKRAAIPSAARPGAGVRAGNGTAASLRPAARSVSAPIDEAVYASSSSSARPAAASGGTQPSVKDLKRRFDLNTSAQATNSHATRKTGIPRVPAREASLPAPPSNYRGVGGPSASGANGSSAYRSAGRSSGTRDTASGGPTSVPRTTQRSKYVAEDLTSNNSQSFASRIAKPKGPSMASSKSMSNLSPTSPTSPTGKSSAPPVPPLPTHASNDDAGRGGKGLLFGEIVPGGGDDPHAAGFGIDGLRRRRTSESNLHSPTGLQQKALSDADVDAEPSSPTDWYRAATEATDGGRSPTKLTKTQHSRAQSDLAGMKPKPSAETRKPHASRAPHQQQPALTPDLQPPSSGKTKLPVSARKRTSPTSSTTTSPPFSRSNSPSTQKRLPTRTQGKVAKPAGLNITPAGRAKTPTTSHHSGRRTPATNSNTPNNNARLNAYISTPPPKLSPPLRSSRPRQPVSTATTASSRMRAVERGRSPGKADPKNGTKRNEQSRRRKVSTGPIDFESRRQQIKLSYTKSIRESEARAAARRQAAAEKERQKQEAEARAKAEAEVRAHARAEAQAQALRVAAEKAEAAEAEAARLAEEEAEAEAQAARLVEEEAETRAETARAAKEQAAAIAAAAIAQRERIERETLDFTEATQQAEKGVDVSSAPAADVAAEPPALVIRTDFAVTQPFDRCSASASSGIASPALGIPGSFPGMGSPEFGDEIPPSAISDTTEFDAEAQTEPPRPQSPLSPTINQRALYRDHEDMPLSISEYKSPFDTTSPSNDGVSVKISLDVSSPQKQAEPTPTPSEFSVGDEISGSAKDEDCTPQPIAPSTYETKVTILGRDSGFPPMSCEGGPAMAKARPKEHVRIKSSVSAHHASDRELSAASSKSMDRDAGIERPEDFYPGPKVSETAARLRDSGTPKSPHGHSRTWSMEEPIAALHCSADTRRTLETRPSLHVPRSSPTNRISQTSVWTDYSIESRGEYPPFPPDLSNRDSACQETASVLEAGSRPQSVAYDRDSRACTSSRGTSPHESYRSPVSFNDQPQLPELDTGGGFVVDYVPRKPNNEASLPIPILPDHSPPPPPETSAFPDLSSAPPSEYFNDTRPNSYAQGMRDDTSFCTTSRPQSENFDQPISTPRSMDQGSFETTDARLLMDSQTTLADSLDQTDIAAGMAPKEKKRLFTRLETIKELVDTEAFFIRDMNIVEEIYKGTAEACPRLDDTTIKLIFRNTDQIIAFHSAFLAELKEGVASVYIPKSHRIPKESQMSDGTSAISTPASGHLSDARDRETSLGPIFIRNVDKMKIAHETFLKNSDQAAKRLIQIQEDPTVKVWLNECNEVARDLTKAWNLDSLLIKPMQRITKYPNLLIQLLHETPQDHPDRAGLESAKASLEEAIEEINKTKKNFELVGQIVGRKRKESDARAGFAKAFGKRVDKLQSANNRPLEDPEYLKIHEKFGDDYLRLQVVLRDVEFYTRQTTTYVHEFLQYLSSMELVMRLQPSPHPEIESKWVRFNVSMRDIEKVALEQHVRTITQSCLFTFN